MPTYTFKCDHCGKVFDIYDAQYNQVCEQCPNCTYYADRIIAKGAAVVFKGKGFHCNDYPKTR